MAKESKAFKIVISILLALTMLISAFFVLVFCLHISKNIIGAPYGIYVDGVSVTGSNEDDILGDGTVYYNAYQNLLVFDNAMIESEDTIVYSEIDLNVKLIGENKFVCKGEEYAVGIYTGDNNLSKDLAIVGDGSLTIEFPNTSTQAVGIFASELTIGTDVAITTSDCENTVNGIVCASSLLIVDKATVTVNNAAANYYCSAVRVRGNALFEEGTTLNITTTPGAVGICKGLSVSGDLFMGKGTTLSVSLDDGATDLGECIRISGLMEIGIDATVTAAAKNTYAIECFGAIEANKGAAVSAASDNNDADVFCSGAVINYGAEFDAEVDAIGGIRNQD